MTELHMPKLSDSTEEGTILTWLKRDGDQVHEGDELVEIETDKATVTHQAEASGLLHILAPEGSSLPVGAPIARLGTAAEGTSEVPSGDGPAAAGPETGATIGDAPGPADSLVPPPAAVTTSVADNGGRSGTGVRATPVARRVAQAHGVALENIAGSGPLGRVTRTDVLAQAGVPLDPAALPAAAVPPRRELGPAAGSQPSTAKGEPEVVELTRLQATVARRMAESKATIPHFQVQTEVATDAASAFRQGLKLIAPNAPSFNDLVVKAAALALREHPLANGSYRDGGFELHPRINIGIAMAGELALVVPTIFDADQKSLGTIATESRQLAGRVRSGEISPAELAGATFTVSNLGMYGMTAITPVINPPQAAILGVGAIREVLARVDGEIVDQHRMTLILSCDHRILYGADAADFLSLIRELLEAPLRLAL